jgi:4-aminobutyrate aminotransferase
MGEAFSRAIATTTPLSFIAGEGAELIAATGDRYLDFISGYGVTNTGHCHPRVVAAVQSQVATLIHVSTVGYTPQSDEYAHRLCRLAPIDDARVFITNSGTEAVEAALKLARYATGRPNVLSFAGAFHGRTMGSLSVTTSKAAFRSGHEPFLPGVYTVPYPHDDLGPTMAAIERVFQEQSQPHRIGACIVEPVLGEGGYVVPPSGFLPALRAMCDEYGIVLILDEVQSGFGRTGKLFACEHSGISPDLMTMSKGIASGLPMGALVGKASLMNAWAPGAHGNTFGGNPVTCAAAMATLDVIEDEQLAANAAARGLELLAGLQTVAADHPDLFVTVRGRGLMIGVELASAELAIQLRGGLLERGVIVSTCGPRGSVIRLAPPLIITTAHVERFSSAFVDAVESLVATSL